MWQPVKEYFKAVLQKWGWLVGGVVGGAFTFGTLAGINPTISLPAGLGLLFVCLCIAQFLVYKDIRQRNKELSSQVITQEWEYARKQRIEFIKSEKYPTEVPSILRKMEQKLVVLVNKAKRQKVTKTQLDMLVHNIFPELSDMQFKGYKKEIIWLFRFQSYMEANGFGLAKVKKGDSEWSKLITQLEDIKKDIPDQELKDHIRDYVMALDGVYGWDLWGYYVDKTNTQPPKELAKAIQAKAFRQDLLEHTFTRIKKRIDELLSGEEPKWELK